MPDPTPVSFRWFSRSPWEWALILYVILCAIRPWAISAILFPNDPAAVHVIYRSPMGDIQYFPMINALAQGNVGENAVFESFGKGVESFPVASLVFHVMGAALLGSYWGYLLADMVVTVAFFLLFRAWCKLFSASAGWASFVAAVFASGFPDIYENFGQIWGQRLPRPFVSDLYFIAGIALLVWLMWQPERLRQVLPWLALGAILAFCSQSFIYYVPLLALAAAYVAAVWAVQDFRRIPCLLARVGAALLVFAILMIPFLVQRAFESPDASGRLGLFPVDRWSIWSNPVWQDTNGAFVMGMYSLMLLGLFNLFASRLKLPPIPGRVMVLLAFLQIGAFILLPLSATLTGKLIQPYHYLIVSRSVQTCLLVALASYVGGGLLPRFSLAPILAGVLLAGSFYVVATREIEADRTVGHLRPDIYSPPGSGYHEAFTHLVKELDRDVYKTDQVLATTDMQLDVYWVGFHHGSAFVPDSSTTTLSNREIEERLLWFSREEGLEADSLARFFDQKATLLFWLEHDRYQCSPLYHLAPLSDYLSEEVARNFDHPRDLGSFALALPQSDLQRLKDRYAQILASPKSAMPRLDLIILAADQYQFPLPDPDRSRYTLTYHDAYFRVWQAIKRVP